MVGRVVGAGDPTHAFLQRRLFGPIGMSSARLTLDDAGTWVASSFLHATARDYARFGLLYLRDGVWGGTRLLPEGWVDDGRRPRSRDPEGDRYGRHWWTAEEPSGRFWAAGHDGQYVDVVPALDLVVVRLGRTGADRSEEVKAWRRAVVGAFV
jgi:CubicO group peptidase (beta-lactamase class C family)